MEYAHVKPGKGKAFVETKLKNLIDGGIIEKALELMKMLIKLLLKNKNFNIYIMNLEISYL